MKCIESNTTLKETSNFQVVSIYEYSIVSCIWLFRAMNFKTSALGIWVAWSVNLVEVN